MFITRKTPVFFDADDGAGGGAPDPEPASLADAQAAREAFLNNPPPITDEPDPEPAAEVDPLDDPALADLTPPAAPVPDPVTPPADPYAEWGGRETVERAVKLDQAMHTESGIRLVVAQSLQALGYTPDQIRAALTGAPVPPGAITEPPEPQPDPLVDVDDDDYVSGADLKRIVARATAAAAEQAAAAVAETLQPTVTSFEQQRQAQASQVADAAYVETLGAYPATGTKEQQDDWRSEVAAVQQAAERFIDPNDWSPQGIRMAILRGAEALKAQREADLARYVARKRAAREANPTNVGGGEPPGGEAAKEPQTLAEARQLAEAAGYFK